MNHNIIKKNESNKYHGIEQTFQLHHFKGQYSHNVSELYSP